MRLELRLCLAPVIGASCVLLLLAPVPARSAPNDERGRVGASTPDESYTVGIADTTWVDHDRQAIRQPPDWQPSYWGRRFHQGLIEPLSHLFDIPDKLLWGARLMGVHTRREAVNVNAFDEVPNSSWFTNRNNSRAVPVAEMRRGPYPVLVAGKPWTITHAKQGGWTSGFQIKDADGKKWLVKLDPRGYPQLSSGTDMVARTLFHAAGYNVPHNESVQFRRSDLTLDPKLVHGTKGERFTEADLDSMLAHSAVLSDSSFSGTASLFLPGHVLGSPSMNRLRPGDSNDWYAHINRRELRGLFVLCSWVNDWDTEDHQFLDTFVEERDSLGHVQHYILDVNASFGASSLGPKQVWEGYENMFDLGWTARRFLTLGFVEEPWRHAGQETGIPSIGVFGSEGYEPEDFKQLVQQPAFHEMTDRDGYWGAKIVSSFSDAQIAAAVEAAQYEDPRASEYLVRQLILRRDAIARHWFDRVAPLDFFSVEDDALHFCDLAVDIGLAPHRAYDVEIESTDGRAPRSDTVHLNSAELPLATLGEGASHVSLELSVAGSPAQPAHVELTRRDSVWSVRRVRHG